MWFRGWDTLAGEVWLVGNLVFEEQLDGLGGEDGFVSGGGGAVV